MGVITEHCEVESVNNAGERKRNGLTSTLKKFKFQGKKQISEERDKLVTRNKWSMWDKRWGIFLEGVTPEADQVFGIHSKVDKERLLITSHRQSLSLKFS